MVGSGFGAHLEEIAGDVIVVMWCKNYLVL